jgi:hypoxanthine-guanine phosphoribosyltransferase
MLRKQKEGIKIGEAKFVGLDNGGEFVIGYSLPFIGILRKELIA